MAERTYKEFNRVPPRPPPRPKTHEYCPTKIEPPPPPEKFCRTVLKKHPTAETFKYKMLRVCPRLDYRDLLCQPIVICTPDECKPGPKVRKKNDIDDDDSWLLPIPKPAKCPDVKANPCEDDIDELNLPPCKPPIADYPCPMDDDKDDDNDDDNNIFAHTCVD